MVNRSGWMAGILCSIVLAGCHGGSTTAGQVAPLDEGDGLVDAGAAVGALERIGTDEADILFVIDDSGSMREEQAALRAQFPRLLRALGSGDLDGDGAQDFPPFSTLRMGVTSTDLGLTAAYDESVAGCAGRGDDGLLLHSPPSAEAGVNGCKDSYPPALAYQIGEGDLDELAHDLSCMASLGTDGCGFEQPLEAALKAAWPSHDPRVTFLDLPSDSGPHGHGDRENAALFDTDPDDPSLLIVVVLTDEDDCSFKEPRGFAPPQLLDPADPLHAQGLNLRCFYNAEWLFGTHRYVAALRALRPNHPERVMFTLVGGVPTDLVDADARNEVDFDDAASREDYYAAMLDDPRMQERVESPSTPGSDGSLTPSCVTDTGRSYPPRRLVEVARGFGENGFVQSLCQSDLTPVIDALLQRMAERR